jgi:DUF971 family protein
VTQDRWPTEVRVKDGGSRLAVAFDNGESFDLPAELLRVESPSAEVQGHAPDQKVLVAGKRSVRITDAEPIGIYAVKLAFSDGHSTGIFSWSYLAELDRRRDDIMRDYEARLEAAGLSR